jgi:putative membrane protein
MVDSFFSLLLGSVLLRPYVFTFLLLYLVAAVADMGWRKTLLFTLIGWGVAFTAESLSIRIGIPFGLYHYIPTTVDRELWIAGVPFMDSLSFVFLAYASFALARLAVLPLHRTGEGWWMSTLAPHTPLHPPVLLLTVTLFVLIDVVVDPVALRGDRWFLGQIFYYPAGGIYFGVPISNFIGWGVVGFTIMILFALLEASVKGSPPAWAERLPLRPLYGPALYYIVLGFTLTVTWLIGETTLFLVGCLIYFPLTIVLMITVLSRWREGASSRWERFQDASTLFEEKEVGVNGDGTLPVKSVGKNRNGG